MAGPDDDEDKQFYPTPKKLEEARKKGDLARSTDLNVAAGYAGLLLAILAAGAWSVSGFGIVLQVLFDRADTMSIAMLGPGGSGLAGAMLGHVALALAPVFLLPAVMVIASLTVQQAFVVAPDKLKPKLSRISPVQNAKNKFGRNGLFEFLKSTTKLTIFSLLLGGFLIARAPEIVGALYLTPGGVGYQLGLLSRDFLFLILCVALTIGVIDFVWQFAEHRRRNRMSRKEIMDETKQTEGDPHMKGARRQRGYDIAMNKMLAEVPSADVVVVNPTHFAVALQWSRLPGAAPECVAKGVDHVAARIRETALEAGVPIHRDPPTARAIHDFVGVGQEIRAQDYRAVAAAIRFAEDMRRKRRWT